MGGAGAEGAGQRPFVRYLLLPRPRELSKAALLAVGWGLGRVVGEAGASIVDALVALLAFELLAYQARYMVNDLLDRRDDAAHPAARSRPRLAGDLGVGAVRLVVAVVVLRLVLAVALALVLAAPGRTTVLVGIAGILVVSVPYELLRRWPLRDGVPLDRLTARDVALYVVVGLGYALRFTTGLLLGTAEPWASALAGLTVVFAMAFGTMTVTMTWVLEATTFVSADWSTIDPFAARKRHLVPLLGQAGLRPPPVTVTTRPVSTMAVVVRRNPTAVWNLALVVASIVAVPLGLLLAAGLDGSLVTASTLAAGWVFATLAVVVVIGTEGTTVDPAVAGIVAIVVELGLIPVAMAASLPHVWVAPAPAVILLAMGTTFRRATFDTVFTADDALSRDRARPGGTGR